ncbi:hypothetical protein ABW21_db0209364 [Orbilia brochopaga]|nr:hypothetical protein ABW21_db0209364 [Drechslerella brochopaga]
MNRDAAQQRFIAAAIPAKHSRPMPTERLVGYYLSIEPRIAYCEAEEREIILKGRKEWYDRGGCWVSDGSISSNGPGLSMLLPESDPKKLLDICLFFDLGFIHDELTRCLLLDWVDGDMMTSVDVHRKQESKEDLRKTCKLILNQLHGKAIVDAVDKDPWFINFAHDYGQWFSSSKAQNNREEDILDMEEYLSDRFYSFGWR